MTETISKNMTQIKQFIEEYAPTIEVRNELIENVNQMCQLYIAHGYSTATKINNESKESNRQAFDVLLDTLQTPKARTTEASVKLYFTLQFVATDIIGSKELRKKAEKVFI